NRRTGTGEGCDAAFRVFGRPLHQKPSVRPEVLLVFWCNDLKGNERRIVDLKPRGEVVGAGSLRCPIGEPHFAIVAGFRLQASNRTTVRSDIDEDTAQA